MKFKFRFAEEEVVAHRVMLVDDASFMRMMLKNILVGSGYEVIGEAENGAKAVEQYKSLKPDLVIMDIIMPEMGGIDAVREIIKGNPSAKILMCSSMGQQSLVVEAIQAGAKDFIVKPFQPSNVLEAVKKVLD
jgi:two-component system chemotaxis response regulator CheY